MNTERIAFLHPFNPDDGESPLLSFDCDELPVIIDVHYKVFMIDLKHEQPVYLQNQIFILENDIEKPVCDPKGLWIKAEDTQGSPDEIMASIRLYFNKCRFTQEGTYMIKASFLKDNKEINSGRAYFRVSKTHD
ncbi:hypothetical protein [Morganella morganii]|uniref:hypothetical protein n=1 Tax=Morganella morganii TaxID=582 RepID=UPI001BDB6685|nr:hypothetical protein [Morganella morganii]MBT0350260.1 hypothetical protein [Morganella morganii subsp. morganii]